MSYGNTFASMSFDDLRKAMLFHRIVEWKNNRIRLDNGMTICIEMTAWDCCAVADGTFENVVLDAAITHVGDIQYKQWEEDGTYGCTAEVTIMHNRNPICKAIGKADAGNGGFYYSIASFIVTLPDDEEYQCHFVSSEVEDNAV